MLILASASPRRQELLGLITKNFSIHIARIEEHPLPKETPTQYVRRMAKDKASSVFALYPSATVIGADTIVCLGDNVLGKPESQAQATAMLTALSGKMHTVYTAVSVLSPGGTEQILKGTEVEFYPLSPEDISLYVKSGEPMDKAGAYGIQEKGALFVKEIRGDFYNVVGLPVAALHQSLRKLGS